MIRMSYRRLAFMLWMLLLVCGISRATETENIGISVLPAPGKVVIDGKTGDWDLSAGVFACGDVERFREKYACWVHAMYDAQYFYVLVRWLDDTPLNNPGQTIANYGWEGDCVQVRLILNDGKPGQQQTVANCWQGKDNRDVVQLEIAGKPSKPGGTDAKPDGALQAFTINPDKKGYVQEIALPWKLLTPNGVGPKAGDAFTMTVEPNFTADQGFRISIKDIFRPGVTIDRIFTFMAKNCWGVATCEALGNKQPRPVRLSDGREFPVHMEKGVPVVDWTGLYKEKVMQGFKPITFTMPRDGYVSLNIKDANGMVVRQLLTCAFYSKGKHTVLWDGLTTTNFHTPGAPVPAGDYTWTAIWHQGIGVKFRGYACNSGSAPWDASATTNWGGDEGTPSTVAADDKGVYLGWTFAEAGKALVACDTQGNVRWRNSRLSMSGCDLLAVDGGIVYGQNAGGNLFRMEAAKGLFSPWAGSDSPDIFVKALWGEEKGMPQKADAMAARGGVLYLAFTDANLLVALDGSNGKLNKRYTVPAPSDVKVAVDGTLYIVSAGTNVLTLNPATGQSTPLITGISHARALALDAANNIYVGQHEPENQVKVYDHAGKPLNTIGRPGGRALVGPWTPDGMAFISNLVIDNAGQLWVAENDWIPKRFSCWDTKTGKLVKEFFGPSSYGALGGAINPRDPNLMVGQGCEWRLDAKTGRATCLGVITRGPDENARFGIGANKRLYLALSDWRGGPVSIYERVGDADYKLRTIISPPEKGQKAVKVWADINGDGQQQPEEVQEYPIDLNGWITGWHMPMAGDMSFYGSVYHITVTGYTACGAPQYDLAKAEKLPAPADINSRGGMGAQRGMGTVDGRYMLYNGPYNVNETDLPCYDIQTGKHIWSYPNNFTGVHGSHNACPPVPGMIRGAYDVAGTAKFPAPLGNIWVISTNFGEWHLLTQDGYYLSRLFEPDPMKYQWPQAVPGASLDAAPCGMGGEDFGGSVTQGTDGHLYIQCGKTGYWNTEVTGLENVKDLKGEKLTISPEETRQAAALRESYLQAATGTRRTTVAHLTPAFTGSLDTDFKGAEVLKYQKQDEAAVRSALACDADNLYLAWEVKDNTPWINGATDWSQMYTGGDTVDLQLGADPKAPANRGDAAPGDLRLSIGNFQGKNTAVIYRKFSTEKKPRTFSSGIVHDYRMDYVDIVAEAKIKVAATRGGYTVEAAIPLAVLGLTPAADLTLRGDLGVTHGDPAGQRTRLRTYWSNQHTGIVDDAVYELMIEPKNWGELVFKK